MVAGVAGGTVRALLRQRGAGLRIRRFKVGQERAATGRERGLEGPGMVVDARAFLCAGGISRSLRIFGGGGRRGGTVRGGDFSPPLPTLSHQGRGIRERPACKGLQRRGIGEGTQTGEQGLHFDAPQGGRRVHRLGARRLRRGWDAGRFSPPLLPSPTRGEGLRYDRRARVCRGERLGNEQTGNILYTINWEEGLHFEAIEGGRRVQVGSVRLRRGWDAGRFRPPLPPSPTRGEGLGNDRRASFSRGGGLGATVVQGSPGGLDWRRACFRGGRETNPPATGPAASARPGG